MKNLTIIGLLLLTILFACEKETESEKYVDDITGDWLLTSWTYNDEFNLEDRVFEISKTTANNIIMKSEAINEQEAIIWECVVEVGKNDVSINISPLWLEFHKVFGTYYMYLENTTILRFKNASSSSSREMVFKRL